MCVASARPVTPQPKQIRGARGLLGWHQQDLAREAGVQLRTVQNVETGAHKPSKSTLAKLKAALEAAGVEFTNGDAPGVRYLGPPEGA